MSEMNPYAAPQGGSPFGANPVQPQWQAPAPAAEAGVWRDGWLLVMHKSAQLPDRCVKSNQPADGRLLRKMYWHHPLIFLSLLAGLLIYVILAIVLQKKAFVHIGLSQRWFAKRRGRIAIAWLLVLLSLAGFVLGVAKVDQTPEFGWMIIGAVFLFLFSLIYGLIATRLVSPKRITNEYVWIHGVHREYLAQLPPWPWPGY